MNEDRDKQNANVDRDTEVDTDVGTDRDTAMAVGEMKSLVLSDSLFLKTNSYSKKQTKNINKASSYSKRNDRKQGTMIYKYCIRQLNKRNKTKDILLKFKCKKIKHTC